MMNPSLIASTSPPRPPPPAPTLTHTRTHTRAHTPFPVLGSCGLRTNSLHDEKARFGADGK